MDKFEDNVTPTQLTEEYREVVDIVPALHKYKADHNIAIYASTQNEQERNIYFDMLDKLNKR